ncbi:MAG: prepilin-type N-terminal cleavage/methylation domain-containing protein [Gimesia sp.]
MYHFHPDNSNPAPQVFASGPLFIKRGRVLSCAIRNQEHHGGFTLVELLMAMAISSILIVALGGIVSATQSAWKHSRGIEDTQAQVTAAFDRIKMMVSQAGVYQVSGQPPRIGLAVVSHSWNYYDIPDTLVVWTGGRNGGISDQGTLTRLPKMSELLIYTIDPNDTHNLIEVALPESNTDVDFSSSSFKNLIRTVINSSSAESALLCNRLKNSQYYLSGSPWGPAAGNLLFEIIKTPSDNSLSSVTTGTSDWLNLSWPQGTASATSGLRQVSIRYEAHIEILERSSLNEVNSNTALPFFGSCSRLYAYTP